MTVRQSLDPVSSHTTSSLSIFALPMRLCRDQVSIVRKNKDGAKTRAKTRTGIVTQIDWNGD